MVKGLCSMVIRGSSKGIGNAILKMGKGMRSLIMDASTKVIM